MSFVKM